MAALTIRRGPSWNGAVHRLVIQHRALTVRGAVLRRAVGSAWESGTCRVGVEEQPGGQVPAWRGLWLPAVSGQLGGCGRGACHRFAQQPTGQSGSQSGPGSESQLYPSAAPSSTLQRLPAPVSPAGTTGGIPAAPKVAVSVKCCPTPQGIPTLGLERGGAALSAAGVSSCLAPSPLAHAFVRWVPSAWLGWVLAGTNGSQDL